MMTKYRDKLANNKELYLSVKVLTGASKTALMEVMADETLKIAVAAVPEKGKANTELIKFLARELVADKGDIKIISGGSDRHKLIKIIK